MTRLILNGDKAGGKSDIYQYFAYQVGRMSKCAASPFKLKDLVTLLKIPKYQNLVFKATYLDICQTR